MTKNEPDTPSGRSFLGSGMPAVIYGLLLVGSVGLFVVWGGPLWRVTHTDSHVSRFVVSYFSVVPVAAIILFTLGRFSWAHLMTTVGTLWAIKLLVTAPLYYALAPGGALEDIGAIAPERGAPAATAAERPAERAGYVPADGSFEEGTIVGHVTRGAASVGGALVYLASPPPGHPLGPGGLTTLVMRDSGFAKSVHVATVEDRIAIRNEGSRMNNALVRGRSTTSFNAPVPPGTTTQPFALDEPSLYSVRSDTAARLRASILVVDHPYAVQADNAGTFTLERVPAAAVRVVALWTDAAGRTSRAERQTQVSPGAVVRIDLAVRESGPDAPDGSHSPPGSNTETM